MFLLLQYYRPRNFEFPAAAYLVSCIQIFPIPDYSGRRVRTQFRVSVRASEPVSHDAGNWPHSPGQPSSSPGVEAVALTIPMLLSNYTLTAIEFGSHG